MPVKIIAIEGIDGVGKSSLCHRLTNAFLKQNIEVAKTPHAEFSKITSLAIKGGEVGALCAYLLADIAAKNQFKNSDWLVLDRYVLSTLVFHSKIIEENRGIISEILNSIDILKPIATIILETNLATVDKRNIERKSFSNHSITSKELYYRFNNYLKDPLFQPWIGERFIMPSESIEDQDNAVQLVLDIIEDAKYH